MKEPIQIPKNHNSYEKHRRQFWVQIFIPILVVILVIIAVAVFTSLAAFGGASDSPRWAAISTIWLVIPVMFFGLVFLILLVGLAYGMARLLNLLPPYTAKAQYYANRATDGAKHVSDMAVKPVMFINGIIASIQAIFGQK